MSRKPKEPEKVFVRPAIAGQIVRDERTLQALDQDGEWKPQSTYWLRRIRMGDVVKCIPGVAVKSKRIKKDED